MRHRVHDQRQPADAARCRSDNLNNRKASLAVILGPKITRRDPIRIILAAKRIRRRPIRLLGPQQESSHEHLRLDTVTIDSNDVVSENLSRGNAGDVSSLYAVCPPTLAGGANDTSHVPWQSAVPSIVDEFVSSPGKA